MREEELKINIKYGNLEAEFSGPPKIVYRQAIAFLEKHIPAYSLAKKISYSIGLQELLDKFSHIFLYDENMGLFFSQGLTNYPVSDAILLMALKNYLEYDMGRLESPTINFLELNKVLPGKGKTISSNLTRLVQRGMLRRLNRGDYTITPPGIKYLVERFCGKRGD